MKNKFVILVIFAIIIICVGTFYKSFTLLSLLNNYITNIDSITILKNSINEKDGIEKGEIIIKDKITIDRIYNLLSSYNVRRTVKSSGKNYGNTYMININQKDNEGIVIYQSGYDVIAIKELKGNKSYTFKLVNARNICYSLMDVIEELFENGISVRYNKVV